MQRIFVVPLLLYHVEINPKRLRAIDQAAEFIGFTSSLYVQPSAVRRCINFDIDISLSLTAHPLSLRVVTCSVIISQSYDEWFTRH